MGYYSYKRVMHSIPKDFQGPWEQAFKEETGRDYDGSADYDGEQWILAADYIEHLHARIKVLEAMVDAAVKP